MESRELIHLKTFSIRGLPYPVNRVRMGARTVDYIAPQGSEHLIVAHDGQNVFDRKLATNRFTWRLAQQASRIFQEANLRPLTILAIFNSTSDLYPHGRALELTPERFFREGLKVRGKFRRG